jgi:hypothetical protein
MAGYGDQITKLQRILRKLDGPPPVLWEGRLFSEPSERLLDVLLAAA